VYVRQEFVNRKTGEVKERKVAIPCKRCGGTA